jgi:UDPglucose 6-dehydrogenase
MVRQGIGSDPRIGHLFLFPGLGYGGSCFPKDMQALIHTAKSQGYTPRLLEAAEEINQDQRRRFVERVRHYFNDNVQDKVFAVWGLSFKPGTDDMREAPSLTVISELAARGASFRAYDPKAMDEAKKFLGGNAAVTFASSCYNALEGADALIINTEWTMFREPDFERMKSVLKQPVIFDGRNLYNPVKLAKLGFQYFYVGQKLENEP